MKYDSQLHNRRSIRWKEHDYSSNGVYYITICTNQRNPILSQIDNGVVVLSDLGRVVERFWQDIPNRSSAVIHEYVIMPDHIHAIIEISNVDKVDFDQQSNKGLANNSFLGRIIRGFKSAASNYAGYSMWQRNYYEHVIRDQVDYSNIVEYIENNPIKWGACDDEHEYHV